MRALIMTFGTRGDIQPYAALAGALSRAGHEVTLAIPDSFADLIPEAGAGTITVHPAGSEMLRLVREVLPELSGARDALTTFGIMKGAMRTQLRETADAARDARPDVIVFHPKSLAGPHLAEAHGIPAVLSIPLPYTPTRTFAMPLVPARLGAWGNRASYGITRLATAMYGRLIDEFRAEIGLAGRTPRFADPLRDRDGSPLHALYPYSRHVVPAPSDYPPTAHVTGYWFAEERAWTPPERLVSFLAHEDPPVYIGFGSMGFGKGSDERRDAILAAVRATGLRAIVATGWGGIASLEDAGDRVLEIDGAPHDWLFPRVSAVVHHGGAGSTAAGLRAGRPTLVVPFLGDQPFWGARVHRLGAGPRPLAPRRLGRQLAPRLEELVAEAGYARRADELGRLIRAEDGPGAAVTALEAIVHEAASVRRG
jgi:sterol 3beta-glucosyltransferase